jgi:hypothetical protein
MHFDCDVDSSTARTGTPRHSSPIPRIRVENPCRMIHDLEQAIRPGVVKFGVSSAALLS